MPHIRIGKHKLDVPGSQIARVGLGILLLVGGVVGFLPVVGFWMLPLGVVLLSYDFPLIRRFRRRLEVTLGRAFGRLKGWWRKWQKD